MWSIKQLLCHTNGAFLRLENIARSNGEILTMKENDRTGNSFCDRACENPGSACPNRMVARLPDQWNTLADYSPRSCAEMHPDRSPVQGLSVIVNSARPTNRA